MGRKAKKSGSGTGMLVLGLLPAIVVAPKSAWTVFLLFLLTCALVAAFSQNKEKGTVSDGKPLRSAEPSDIKSNLPMSPNNIGSHVQPDDEFLTVTLSSDSTASSYRVARPSLETAPNVRWVGADETIEMGGVKTCRQRLVGVPGRGEAHRGLDACVLNLKANIARSASDGSNGLKDYWLSYNGFSAEQRRAYLQWLASDRSDPRLHRSFAAFYPYGLERRVLVDGMQGKVTNDELKDVANELKRLNAIYPDALRTGYIDGLLGSLQWQPQ
ncbi:hypothetical protein GNZ12_06680 [Paraburkholderia sp. 1N]|uniref:TerB N-terminal domain-containing protein n=1 Tax=Paraburkholderia solitsugae TaxID=2675748 RepID=A0ABX2BMG3_9BURK|nr:TerB N-terminal domain-containing protein [Paraburkholderia solitsugae]NPT41008.1 hypothetical protein [Paraburkholderia solitsugae]